MNDHRVSVILPIYNQADHVEGLLEDYEQALARLPSPHELILVINGCRDQSLDLCRAKAQKFPAIRILASDEIGWGCSVIRGLKAAEGDILCYTNSARTHSRDLTLAILYALTNPDVVIKANRKIRDRLVRRMGSLLYNIEVRTLFDLSNWDVNGTPKVFPRKFDRLLGLTETGDLIDAEFCWICRREGYPMLEIPTFSPKRHGGASTTAYRSAINMYVGAFRLWRRAKRRKLS